jgi:hypothetical protein
MKQLRNAAVVVQSRLKKRLLQQNVGKMRKAAVILQCGEYDSCTLR